MRGSASSGTCGAQAYGEAWYWDKRYSQDQDPAAAPFDWYQKYPSLAPLFHLYIPPSPPSHPHLRLLVVGCGNSGMSFNPFYLFLRHFSLFDQGSCLLSTLFDGSTKNWVHSFCSVKNVSHWYFFPPKPLKILLTELFSTCSWKLYLGNVPWTGKCWWDGNAAWPLFACHVF